ncbi:hypothetical protein F5141DRAFT_1220626 [Pisolithus sp. B1]|nr:hypothetical protein F5141DRAFT_1220626 [Pisolithus sp. B1]
MSANPWRRPFTRRRRAGLVLATPSNSSSISNGAHTVVPEKRKPSEDTPGVHPRKKVTRPSPLGSTPFLIGGPSSHQVVSLKRQRSEELVGTYPFNKVARVVIQGIDMPPRQHYSSDEVAGNNWKNLQGDPKMLLMVFTERIADPHCRLSSPRFTSDLDSSM